MSDGSAVGAVGATFGRDPVGERAALLSSVSCGLCPSFGGALRARGTGNDLGSDRGLGGPPPPHCNGSVIGRAGAQAELA